MNGNYSSRKKCLIVASGELGNVGDISAYLDGFAIFADGGLRYSDDLCIKPDLIIGDMDSFDGKIDKYNCKVIEHDCEKDDTDTGLCVKYAVENGYDDIVIVGGMGGRFDHTFANIQIMAYAANEGADIKMVKDDTVVYVTKNSPIIFDNIPDKYISVFALSDYVIDVTLEGMKYPLNNELLKKDFPIGVSNECVEDICRISFKSGILAVMVCGDT